REVQRFHFVKAMPPNGLEMSRPASPKLVSHEMANLGWPGRLHRVDYMKALHLPLHWWMRLNQCTGGAAC
ncbi:MAG TPA: hypothetical protein VJA25_09745, partial [Dehalococcoidia bacterium]|nr:hypothetical protein [Dehalococcoidia bacterium]